MAASSDDRHSTNLQEKPLFLRTITLYTVVALNVGQIVGAGIFIAPKGVLLSTRSAGLSLIVWALSGVITTGASLCYAELASMVKESGGPWAYIRCGLSGAPAFVASIIYILSSAGSLGLVCRISAEYILSLVLDDCSKMPQIITMLAVCIIYIVAYINTSTHWVQRLLKVALIVKTLALVSIVVGGGYWMAVKGTKHLEKPFEGTTKNGWSVAVSFYSGLFAYNGWDNITNVTEEVKNYKRNIPLGVFLSISFVTILYILVNISYYVVLGTDVVLESDVVVLDWGIAVMGSWGVIYSFLVSASSFGATLSSTFSVSRQLSCVAREGHTVQLLSMVDAETSVPIMAIFARATVGAIFILSADGVVTMLNFLSFMRTFVIATTLIALIKLKIQKYNDDEDRFRVPLALPIVMTLVYIYLALVPVINDPNWYYLYGIIISMCSLILYFPFVKFNVHLACFDKVTLFFQRLFGVAVPDKSI